MASIGHSRVIDGLTILPLAEPVADGAIPRGARAVARLRHFVVDDRNWCALAAVDAILAEHGAIAQDANQSATQPAIVVLHGPSGVGKSHLAKGLAAAWTTMPANGRSVYITGADFARRFMPHADEGETNGDVGAHSRRDSTAWRDLGLLVLDNLDELVDKESAQQQLVFAIDELTRSDLAQGRPQIIVTSRTNPTRDRRFLPALRSRLAAGLNAPLKTLGPQGRYHVLETLALARGMALDDATLRRIADAIHGTVAQLAGALAELELATRAAGASANHGIGEELVAACLKRRATTTIAIKTIAQRTAEAFRVKLTDLRGPSRRKELVAARSVAIYLARSLTSESLQAIGRYFGGRDHATVLYNIAKVTSDLQAENSTIAQSLAQLRDQLDIERAHASMLHEDE